MKGERRKVKGGRRKEKGERRKVKGERRKVKGERRKRKEERGKRGEVGRLGNLENVAIKREQRLLADYAEQKQQKDCEAGLT